MGIKEQPDYTYAAVGADNVLAVWDQVEPQIARAMAHDYSGATTEQVLGRILLGELMLIVVAKRDKIVASMTIENVDRRQRICHCMTFAGEDMQHWCDGFIDAWKEIGRSVGARYLSIKGRPGWLKYARQHYGFQHAYTQMYLDLESEK